VTQLDHALSNMHRMSASVNRDREFGNYGQVLWAGEIEGRRFGIAWDWAEMFPHVVAMTDPMSIQSNMILLDDAGGVLADSVRVVRLNSAVHGLAWQHGLAEGARSLLAA
jgi:hypothetical protein